MHTGSRYLWWVREPPGHRGSRYLRWVRKPPLAWPEPSQPGVGHVGPSFLGDFQNEGPLREPSFCRRAASGQPDALRWEAYLPLTWPSPTQPGTGHLAQTFQRGARGARGRAQRPSHTGPAMAAAPGR